MASSLQLYDQPKSIESVSAQRDAIVNLMSAAMVKDVDFGKIPGTTKPSLYKPGSEKLLSMFHLAAKPVVEDLSTPDCMRYRVSVQISEMGSGRYLGEGIGEASSAETKYQWRAIVCEEEWQQTPEDRRRAVWKKGTPNPYQIKQVRTIMEDVANTILKMAKKRAQIDAVLTVTAASDVFSQDVEDLVAAGLDADDSTGTAHSQQERPNTLQPKQQSAPQQTRPAQSSPSNGGPVISEAQGRLLYARAKSAGKDGDLDYYIQNVIGVSRREDIPRSKFEAALAWAEGK